MPAWMQLVVAVAGFVLAVGVLYNKVFRTGYKAARRTEDLIDTIDQVKKMLPKLTEITEQLGDAAKVLPVVREIVAEFRTDGGSSLKDQMNDIEGALAAIKAERIEVAGALAAAQVKVDQVAADLAAQHERANQVTNGVPREQADAASTTTDPPPDARGK